ncbi:ADYC domain-containing protein [Hydrocarboniphaga sp.]|uniref:ADYC domain-containing protein n=1 Tax=Hydrocarboniphaga sp. TaxID=2033016 RepID=UPI003D107BC5
MKLRTLLACLSLMLTVAGPRAIAADTVTAPDLTAEHTGFVLKLADGRVLSGQQMQGAIVHMAIEGGKVASIKLASIVPDPKDPDILRHEFQVQNEAGEWKPACQANFYGETWGFPIALPEGHPGREAPITLTCSSGAVGKCVRFGYKPWAKGPHGEDLLPYHAACVHMVRADYVGDGTPHTKNGTDIDVYDHIGIQSSESQADPQFGFEAGWSPTGAVCVAHTRWRDVMTTENLLKTYPQFAKTPRCDDKTATALGALVFNRSKLN